MLDSRTSCIGVWSIMVQTRDIVDRMVVRQIRQSHVIAFERRSAWS